MLNEVTRPTTSIADYYTKLLLQGLPLLQSLIGPQVLRKSVT